MYFLQKASVPGPTAWKTFVTQISTPLQILNTPAAPKICQNALALADGAMFPGQTTMGELTMLPKSPNRIKIGISPPSRISPISLHQHCRRLDPRR